MLLNEVFQFSTLNMVTYMYVDTQIYSFSIINDTQKMILEVLIAILILL